MQTQRGATHHVPGAVLTDHTMRLPLVPADPDGRTVEVYAREVVAPDKQHHDLPWLLFLQGGPGMASPRPKGRDQWLDRALRTHRVLLLDQRGTGRSSPCTAQTLAGRSPEQQAEHLGHFRADGIVADAEAFRAALTGDRPWTLLGQSFGGFVTTAYLSAAPEGVEVALVTGGLPPLDRSVDDVYRATYPRVRAKNAAYFARYPHDRERVDAVVRYLRDHDVRLPDGDRLTAERFLGAGHPFGMSTGFEGLHYTLEGAFTDAGELSADLVETVGADTSFSRHPLYALLHEAEYCEGAASRWAAQRVRDELPDFDPDADSPLLVGEMIYPWMLGQRELLALRDAGEILAERDDWPPLYDRARLATNPVPVHAAVYLDDMYVEAAGSLATAASVGNVRTWVTNEYEHDGLRRGEVLDRLLDMATGAV